MNEIVTGIGANHGVLTAIATVVIAVSAIVTVFFTGTLARENKLLRKAETEPAVIAYLAPHPLYYSCLNFVLANVGRGPARNVSFKFDADESDFEIHDVALRNSVDRKAINFLPQGESICLYFGNEQIFEKKPELRPFDVVIEFHDLKDRHRFERCRLDVAQFEGFTRLGDPPEMEIAKALKKIEKHLESIKKETKDS